MCVISLLAVVGCDHVSYRELVEEVNKPKSNTGVSLVSSESKSNYNQESLVRFDTSKKIPLYYISADGGEPSNDIIESYQEIENIIGDVFEDFHTLRYDLTVFRDPNFPKQNRGNGKFTSKNFYEELGIDYGIIVAEGTGYFNKEWNPDPQKMCANASSEPYSGGTEIHINSETGFYAPDTVLWVNMGNGVDMGNGKKCEWDKETVVHETAHAMGMFNHLSIFGDGPQWSPEAKKVLEIIYKNAGGTKYSDLAL